jgi:hypothetical protein
VSPERTPLFLARRSYRRRRLADAARILPLIGGVLFCLPLLWKGSPTSDSTVQSLIYIFGLWVILILTSAIISRHLRLDENDRDDTRNEHQRPGGT